MESKTALVTGASSDTGRAVALSLASAGYDIAAHYHGNPDGARVIEKEAGEYGVRTAFFKADLTRPQYAEKMVQDVIKAFGRMDVLVNTVGPFYVKNISLCMKNFPLFNKKKATNFSIGGSFILQNVACQVTYVLGQRLGVYSLYLN